MNEVAFFEKVSFEQYKADYESLFSAHGFVPEMTEDELRREWENIRLPQRATKGSAGYDFFIPRNTYINGRARVVPTGIRAGIFVPGWFLLLCPKSGLGFKYGAALANTCGIVDSDYAQAKNEGHILVKMYADTSFDLKAGDKFVQGIFLPFGITNNDAADADRTGGFGSTGQ